MEYFSWKLSIKIFIPHHVSCIYHRPREVSVKGLCNTLLWKIVHQVHKNKAFTDEALTYMLISINGYIKMKMASKQAGDPIRFKQKSSQMGS